MNDTGLAQAVLAGDRLALARTLTQVENNTAQGKLALSELFPHTGKAHLVGVTGASGTGKSSLVNQLARFYRQAEQPRTVGIVAVDPTSPFSGGAILGDRIRMRDLAGDPGVFIRSMATRGSLGGLASATASVVQVLDAAGYDLILIETVGAGQSEVEIARLALTTLVVEAPGLGDDIQAIKAGIMEIADVLVVNKADLPGAENTERLLRGSLNLAHPASRSFMHHGKRSEAGSPGKRSEVSGSGTLEAVPESAAASAPLWMPPILRTVALDGTGIPQLAEAITNHRTHLETYGGWQERERWRLQTELDMLVQNSLVEAFRSRLTGSAYETAVDDILARRTSPSEAVQALIKSAGC